MCAIPVDPENGGRLPVGTPARLPPAIAIEPGCILLVHHRLDLPADERARLEAVLSPDERARAARFHFQAHRHRAIVTWGLVRTILGRVVQRAPESLRFERADQGKPALPDGPSFNISDSHHHLLMAIAADGRLGVDVEVRRTVADLMQLAEQNFSRNEARALQTLPPAERERAFFRIWTCKEAFVKALGGGLFIPLDSFSVTPPADNGRVALRIDGPEQAVPWSLFTIGWDSSLEAAVAWDRPEARLVWLARPGGE